MTSFDHRIQPVSAQHASLIAKIDELKGQWLGGATLSPQVLGRLKRSVLVTSTGASTRIEGAKLSDEDVEKVMRGLNIQTFADRDKQEVKGYYELLTNAFDSWRTIRFGESTIKHWHKELLKYVEKDVAHRGEYKKQENKVQMIDAATGKPIAVLFATTPLYLTPKAIQELVDWTQTALTNRRHHPLLVIGNFVVEFLKIHPFTDGNGRLSRVLTNLLLLQAGYEYVPYVSHEKLVEDNKAEYYITLRKSQQTFGAEKKDITAWLDFFLNIVLQQSQRAVELLKGEEVDKLLTAKQRAVLLYLQQVAEASPGEIAGATDVAQPTVRQALAKLVKLKKVERQGQGRSTTYRIAR
ncbi:MAG: Fic family protein [Candidatus Andersenbacteria bacterium]|nr:Fic family protein [Candidatus Andersenbacteria bacterium]